MAEKKFMSLERLQEYDALIKAKIDDGDASILESAKSHADSGDETVLSTAKSYVNEQIAAIPTPDVSGQIATHNEDTTAHTDIRTAIDDAKSYAEEVAASAASAVKNELLNGAGEAYDTLKELGDLIDENTTALDALETVATGKADADHTHDDRYYTEVEIDEALSNKADIGHIHAISEVTDLQDTLDSKASQTNLDKAIERIEKNADDIASFVAITEEEIVALFA